MADLLQLQKAMDDIAKKVAYIIREHVPSGTVPDGSRFNTHWDGRDFASQEAPHPDFWRYWVRPWRADWGLGDDGAFIALENPRALADPPPKERVGPLEIIRKRPAPAQIRTFVNPTGQSQSFDVEFEYQNEWSSGLDIETTIKAGFEAQFGSPESSPISAKTWGEISTSIKTTANVGVSETVRTAAREIVVGPYSKRTVTRERHEADARRHVVIEGNVTCSVRVHDAYRMDWYWGTLEDFIICFKGGAPRHWHYDHDLGKRLSDSPASPVAIWQLECREPVTYAFDMPMNGAGHGEITISDDEPL